MSEFSIKYHEIQNVESGLKSYAGILSDASGQIKHVSGNLSFDILSKAMIAARLRGISDAVNVRSENLRVLSNTAEQVRMLYYDTEKTLCGNEGETSLLDVFSHLRSKLKDIGIQQHASLDEWREKALAAEYAKLCGFCSDLTRKGQEKDDFIKALKALPNNDPLKNIDPNQIDIVTSDSGMTAVVIKDGDKAVVIFAGTNEGGGDVVADIQLALGQVSQQEAEANALIKQLSSRYSDITVTGHSLGGYLATSVTLNNDKVSRCIAFDPPGRYDAIGQDIFNSGRASKVTTYEAVGSLVSKVGHGVGTVVKVPVQLNFDAGLPNHDIHHITDAIGGDEAINTAWV